MKIDNIVAKTFVILLMRIKTIKANLVFQKGTIRGGSFQSYFMLRNSLLNYFNLSYFSSI
ncbi:MAG: hypothetical protein N2560_02950 [Ignavibacteria bacterium]|nr:hypothetical protein [Ignavibacteria bacterium]